MKYGLIGEKLAHSFSPDIHKKIGDYPYELLELARDEVGTFMTEKDFLAINVTIPYKKDVIPYLDVISDEAKRIGSVNTVVNKNGVLYGYNTDHFGMSGLIMRVTNGEKLSGKVKAVKLSQRLKTHPVCITSEGMLSLEMEKVLSAMPEEQARSAKAQKILEINTEHPIFAKLKALYESDKDAVADYADILYTQALLIEGMAIENPVEFTNKLCEIMAK